MLQKGVRFLRHFAPFCGIVRLFAGVWENFFQQWPRYALVRTGGGGQRVQNVAIRPAKWLSDNSVTDVADVLPNCCRFAGVKLLIDNNVADVADFTTCNANSIKLRSIGTAQAFSFA